MWKRKVRNDYGIEKMYGNTWKETVRFLFEADMNGRTYNDLFYEGLESKDNKFLDRLIDEYKVGSYFFPDNITTIEQDQK